MKSRPGNCTARSGVTLASLLLLGFTAVAHGEAVIDCPQRNAAYSVDSPLMDVLLKAEARAAIDEALPGLLQKLPAGLLGTAAPSFSSIVTLRAVASFMSVSPADLEALDAVLSQLPVTAADQDARCERYDVALPELEIPEGAPRLLLFEKMTGFRDTPSVEAAHAALVDLAQRNGWAIVATDKGGAITPEVLQQFDAVIWNNVSGDVLTMTQRAALQAYIEGGGGFVGLHGSAGDPVAFWDWYVDTLIGAHFAGHPTSPQFQAGRIVIEDAANGIARGLPAAWTLEDEWYSFKNNPRASGATVIATLDESTYSPIGMAGKDLRMGADHPIAWTRCVVDGRSFYSAIGHRPEVYSDPHHRQLLQQAILWSSGRGTTLCREGRSIAREDAQGGNQ